MIKQGIKRRLNKYKGLFKLKKLIGTAMYQTGIYKLFGKTSLGVHLGGGDLRIDSFINIDINPYCNADVISSINKIKLKNNSVKYIYNSHILEHIPRANVNQVISEWYRILEKDGLLFISVPDIENIFQIYLNNLENYEEDSEKKRVADLSCGIVYGGQIDKYDFHYMGYSFKTLKAILEYIGFRNIKRVSSSELPFTKPKDASEVILDGKAISLNVVCEK